MNKEKLAREELIGLHVKIIECDDPTWIGRSGLIVNETKNTFLIEINGQEKTIAKKTAIFEFDYNTEKITIYGKKIEYRPENRIKKVR